MKLVVDTNILFTFFWKESVTKEMLSISGLELFSPEFSLVEIKKYQDEIMSKTGLSKKEFEQKRIDLALSISFVALSDYSSSLKDAIAFSPDKNDSDFFALALKIDAPLWSNDKNLKNQSKVKVLSTKDLLESPEFMRLIIKE